MTAPASTLIRSAALVTAALLLVGCSGDDDTASPTTAPPPTESDPGEETPDEATDGSTDEAAPSPTDGSLEAIAEACADGGPVGLDSDVVESNTSVDIPDCEIHLEPGVSIDLSDLSITGGDLVWRESDDGPGTNLVTLERLSIDVESFVLELNDADDAIRTNSISITTTDGIDVRVGDLGDEGEGGTIHLVETSLTATGPEATVHLLTSERSGTLRLERSSIDAPGAPRLSGAECSAEVNDEQLACDG